MNNDYKLKLLALEQWLHMKIDEATHVSRVFEVFDKYGVLIAYRRMTKIPDFETYWELVSK